MSRLTPFSLACLICAIVLSSETLPVRGQSATREALKKVPAVQEQFLQRLKRAKSEFERSRQRNRAAHLIIGRIQLEAGDDPETVVSQMIVLEGGFFVDVIRDLKQPVWFHRNRYQHLGFVVPEGLEADLEGIIDVGVLTMSRTSDDETGSLVGRLELESGAVPSDASVSLRVLKSTNTPSGGTEGTTQKHYRIGGTPAATGKFSIRDLTAGEYYASFAMKGYVGRSQRIMVSKGRPTDIGRIKLDLPRKLEIEYVIAQSPVTEFDASAVKTMTLASGNRWKSRSDIYGFDLSFEQQDGQVRANYVYAPCYMKDLGAGLLADHLTTKLEPLRSDARIPLHSGHVYLLDQRSWKHHVLFRIVVGDPIPPAN